MIFDGNDESNVVVGVVISVHEQQTLLLAFPVEFVRNAIRNMANKLLDAHLRPRLINPA